MARICCLLPAVALLTVGGMQAAVAGPYVEGAVGVGIVHDANTKTYTLSNPPDTATGRIALDYKHPVSLGAELGVSLADQGLFRFSLSYDNIDAELRSATVSGTVNGTPGSITFQASDLKNAGYEVDSNIHLVAANVYYSPLAHFSTQPYVGLGVGAALFSHADGELALTATVGVRQVISNSAFLGLRYRYARISGPTDDLGLEYEPIRASLFSAVAGFSF